MISATRSSTRVGSSASIIVGLIARLRYRSPARLPILGRCGFSRAPGDRFADAHLSAPAIDGFTLSARWLETARRRGSRPSRVWARLAKHQQSRHHASLFDIARVEASCAPHVAFAGTPRCFRRLRRRRVSPMPGQICRKKRLMTSLAANSRWSAISPMNRLTRYAQARDSISVAIDY